MALDSTQRRLINSLLDKPQTIRQLIVSTGLSDSTVRQTLKVLTQLSEVKMDKERQPYLYSVSENSSVFKSRQSIDKVKAILRKEVSTENPVMKLLAKIPKEQLRDWPIVLRDIAEGIEELDKDGELIDTLETT